jgi:hypothetical protein
MPLYKLECSEGCEREEFCHVADDKGCQTYICPHGEVMTYTLSVGAGLTYFEEGRARVIENLFDQPVTVRSHREHQALMRKAKVDWATAGTGRKGCWT